jgi:hypothetical protein
MSYRGISFSPRAKRQNRCACCRELKREKNGRVECDTCRCKGCGKKPCACPDACVLKPWGGYQRHVACPYVARRRRQKAAHAASCAWTAREKAEKAGGR